MTIYLVVNRVNGKYYVGKTKQKLAYRWQRHLKEARLGNKAHLYCAIRKYGAENFTVHPLMSTLTSNEQLCEQEQFLIALFHARDPEVGYNTAPGGEGGCTVRGECHPRFGKKFPRTPDHPFYGTSPTKGKPMSEEQKQKISKANSGRKRPDLAEMNKQRAGCRRPDIAEMNRRRKRTE